MTLLLLKNHLTTARILRPGTTRNCTLLAIAAVLLLLPATTLVAQQPSEDAEAPKSGVIYETYQKHLEENQRRLSDSEDAYQQQIQKNQAAQVYVPPVHISPKFPPRKKRPRRSLNGRFNSVQNYTPLNKPARVSISDEKRPRRSTASASRTRQIRDAGTSGGVRGAAPSSAEHVFLQDRIANALARTFGGTKARSKNKSSRTSPAVGERNPTESENLPPIIKHRDLETVSQEAYASKYKHDEPRYAAPSKLASKGKHADEPTFADEPTHADGPKYAAVAKSATEQEETSPRGHSILDRSDDDDTLSGSAEESTEQQADIQRADVIPPRVFVPNDSEEVASRVVPSSYEVKRRRTNKSTRVAKRAHRLKAPRPVSYRPRQNKLRATEVSVLAQEKEESLDDLDFDLPLDGDETQDSLSDEEFPSPLRPSDDSDLDDLDDSDLEGSGTKPDQRDDLESMEDDDREKELENDRIRSRLNDDLDDLDDDLDDIDDEEFDDDDLEVQRPTDRPCNDFRDELLSTSIRDISLDISPGAYSETSLFGGPNRSWTNRSGNVIANGTMVDLRRGYVILDTGQKIPYSKLGVSDLAAVSEFWRLPTVCLLGNRGGSPYRNWAQQTVTWKSTSLCHKPLYFENRQLERYGHSRGPFAQPLHSTVHFFTSLISLPYQTAINPPNECQYALGFFRPGDCAPWLKDPIPISLEGATRQALLTTGGAFIP